MRTSINRLHVFTVRTAHPSVPGPIELIRGFLDTVFYPIADTIGIAEGCQFAVGVE